MNSFSFVSVDLAVKPNRVSHFYPVVFTLFRYRFLFRYSFKSDPNHAIDSDHAHGLDTCPEPTLDFDSSPALYFICPNLNSDSDFILNSVLRPIHRF
ncbi:hypothetical protein EVAR_85277_1 [Eumeta japonica]|uniref:Uncharacterized protein n=1 Tax=Eumeta variegata TaxID=151549 RepID=A0A4C1V8B2_EUMVA|nr:hypothetical protein EVAR_85277_1 [Eumeta japonica]